MCERSGKGPRRGLRVPARVRARLDPGHRGRGARRRRAPADLAEQAAGRALGRDHRGLPPRRPALDLDRDVRPHRGAARAGPPHAGRPGAAGADRRDHRVRPAQLHPLQHDARPHPRDRGDLGERRTSSTPPPSAWRWGRTIPNLQASWVKMGLEAATEALRWGVNDLGGTLMEENISRMAGSQHGVRLEPEQLIEAARAAGREPAQRTTLYEIVETYEAARRRQSARAGMLRRWLAEEVLVAGPAQGRRPGAVLLGDVAAEAADDRRRHAARPCRGPGRPPPRPRRRSRSAVASSSRPSASARPRQSSSGASPAQPIATSAWPRRQARPKLSATIDRRSPATPAAVAISARMRRAEASGSSGSRQTVSVVGQVGAVDAGVGADEAVVGFGDQDAALGAQHLAALGEDQLDQRRLLAEHRRQLARLGAGDRPRRGGAPGPRPWRRSSARRRRRRRRSSSARAAISSPSGIPSLDLRQPGDRDANLAVAVRRSLISPGALGRAPGAPPRPAPRARGSGRSTSAGVSRSSASEAQLLDREGDAGLAGGGDVAGAAALAEGGLDRARAARARARWCRSPWRSGTIAT